MADCLHPRPLLIWSLHKAGPQRLISYVSSLSPLLPNTQQAPHVDDAIGD